MSVLRHYVMIAAEGQESAMAQALTDLAAKVRPLAGCQGVELLQDARERTCYVFIERWASIDAHKEGARYLGKEALAPVMAVIARPPEGRYLEPLPVG